MKALSVVLHHPTLSFPPLVQRYSRFPIDTFHQVFANLPVPVIIARRNSGTGFAPVDTFPRNSFC
jgi:hypothetical protein